MPEDVVQDLGAGGGPSAPPAQEPLAEIHVEALHDPLDDPNAPPPPPPVAIMDKGKFFEFFTSVFVLSGNMVAAIPPLYAPMQTLTHAPNLPTARPAADAIYDLAQKYDWLHWLIEEDTDSIKALMTVGAFGAQVAMALRNEIQYRNNAAAAIVEGRPHQPHSDEGNRTAGQGDPNAHPTARPAL